MPLAETVQRPPIGRTGALTVDDVYERLRLAIVTGELRPNEPLIELDLAEALKVSRTPVRESLQRLGVEGHATPRKRGWAVREYSSAEIEQNFEVRTALEGYAARLAATRASADELALIDAVQHERDLAHAPTIEFRVASNRAFHDAIIAAAHNERLSEAIFRAGQFYFNQRIAGLTTEGEFKANQADHGRVVRALAARDAAGAEEAMRAHIEFSYKTYRRITGATA
ncbi:MAG: GntR family transcriptional regulator [Rhodoblastus sp.]